MNAAETGAAKTEFETSSESTFLASVTLKNGDDVEIQFHTLDEAVSFSIATESPDDGCEFAVELYEWNENIKKTLRGEKLHSWTVSDWADAGEITVDFTKLSGGALGAGEYALKYTLVKGTDVVFKGYKPAVRGICCYEKGYRVYGSYTGRIIAKNPVEKMLDFASYEQNVEYHTAPPEWTRIQHLPRMMCGKQPAGWRGNTI